MNLKDKEQPLVSIIMPAYNCEKYIADSIDSILEQTYVDWELIVVDDGSSDATENIILKYIDKYENIKYFKNKENVGVSATRNRAIRLSSGKYIAFLDSDDLWTKDKLEKQVSFMLEHGHKFTFTASSFIDENGDSYTGIFNIPKSVKYKKLKKQNVISCSSVVIEKGILERFDLNSAELHEDFLLWLTIMKKGIVAYGINEPMLIYRISKNSKSGNKKKSIKMTYNTYRADKNSKIKSYYYLMFYVFKSFFKYRKIKKK